MRKAMFWPVSAVGRKSSREFKQQQGKFRLDIRKNFPMIRLMKQEDRVSAWGVCESLLLESVKTA